MSVEHGEQRGEVGAVMGGAVTARPCLFLWGGADQLVPLCCWSNKEPCAHMALTNCGVARVYTSTSSVHTSLQTHMLSLLVHLPPYMTVPLLLKTILHWSRAGTVCSRWKVRKSH